MVYLPDAACAGKDPTWWEVLLPHEDRTSMLERRRRATAICHECPVRAQCEELRLPGDEGIWGGHLYALTARKTVAVLVPLTYRKSGNISDILLLKILEYINAGYGDAYIARTLEVHRRTVWTARQKISHGADA
jgi:hypothetical protein